MDIRYSSLIVIISFAITFIVGYPLIKFLRNLKVRQTERVEGVQSHLKKAGTPTMGGIMMITAFNILALYYSFTLKEILPCLILADGFALIGFVDDYLKVVLKRSDGFKPKQKFLSQVLLTVIYGSYLHIFYPELLYKIRIPFIKGEFDIGIFGIVLMFFAIMGTVNAVNFTDGIDGLASSVTLVVALFFLLVSIFENNPPLMIVSLILIGALLGFLLYNWHPAKIFMGDTGSLFLGGLVVSMAYMHKMVLFILIIGVIYFIEILSVMIQVTYFKKTGGKRIFKMTPIHHHFELSGWNEIKIDFVFTLVTAGALIIGILAL